MEGEIIKVFKVWMEGEINNFIKVWLSVFISLSYCYVVGKFVPKGTLRLFTILPVICLFLYLPLLLHSMHLGGMTAFFIAWLANFKVLMFAFGMGPLSAPSISLLLFVALACFPIKIQQNPPPNNKNTQNPSIKTSNKGPKSPLNYAIKTLLIALIVRVYDYNEHLHPKIIKFIFCFHVYFSIEVILAMVAALAHPLLGVELEPQFDEPYLSTSLQDFWGRRWNIMVTRILRPTVYEPLLKMSTQILGRKWAPLLAVLGTFVASAIMHELVFYYLGRVMPTFEITCFFLLHGVCLVIEIAIKKVFTDKWRLPQIISGPLTAGFVVTTCFWLFVPVLFACKGDVRALEEYAAVGAFVKDFRRALSA